MDFLDRLEDQLVERARQDVRKRGRARWSGRSLAFAVAAGVAVLAVPAAAVTGVFSRATSHSHHIPNGPGLVSLNPPCVQKGGPPPGRTTTNPPPAAITQSFAIFRRPQVAADRLPNDRLRLAMMDGVNPEFVRRVTSSNGLHAYLIPAQNVNYRPGVQGKGPGCKQLVEPRIEPEAGICLRLHSGGSCGGVSGIVSGKSLLTEGGSTHGRTLAAGIVPDGVQAVIWRVRRGTRFLDTRIPVRDNVYIGRFPGRRGHGLFVYFVDARGKHLVIGPPLMTAKQRAQRRRDAKLDRTAGPTPTVAPSIGGERALFVLRMRVRNLKRRYVYAVTVTGRQPGACSKPYRYRIGMLPGREGSDRGLMRAAFGPGPGYLHWCAGTYRGTVRRQANMSRTPSGPVVGRFAFTVR